MINILAEQPNKFNNSYYFSQEFKRKIRNHIQNVEHTVNEWRKNNLNLFN